MATSAFYTTHVFGSGSGGAALSMPLNTSVDAKVDATRYNERPSIEIKVSSSGAKIANAVVVDSSGRPLYSISSDLKRTKLLLHKDNTEAATIDWDHSSPRMVFRGKQLKCKEWLLPGPNRKSRIFVHGDSKFTWIQRPSHGFLIPANRPGLAIAMWHIKSCTDELRLQIFQEALLEPGLLEAIVLSIILLQSGHSFGDSNGPESISSTGPKYFSAASCLGMNIG